MDPAGRVLVGERVGLPDSWQFPQGGLDPHESPEEGLPRELHEELSLEPDDYAVETKRGPYRYLVSAGSDETGISRPGTALFPAAFAGTGVQGQCPHGPPRVPRGALDRARRTFRLAWLPEMKHEVYRQVFRDFFGLEIS